MAIISDWLDRHRVILTNLREALTKHFKEVVRMTEGMTSQISREKCVILNFLNRILVFLHIYVAEIKAFSKHWRGVSIIQNVPHGRIHTSLRCLIKVNSLASYVCVCARVRVCAQPEIRTGFVVFHTRTQTRAR